MAGAPESLGAAASSGVPHHDGLRRLQIGVGGVLIILLLVAMAGLASDRARETNGTPVAVQDATGNGAGNNSAPLEELGIQPVTKDGVAGAAVAAPSVEPLGANSGRGGVPDLELDPELERARQLKP